MLLSLNWLKDFIDIPKSISPRELGERLRLHTVEVEKVEEQANRYKNVVVGKILEVKPHPNADRLRLVLVDIGPSAGSGQFLKIVCGADNIQPGQFVPVALVGAVLPASGREIKPAEIRGVKSNGMLCAQDELGLGEDHAGIMILEKARIGQNFADYLKLDDVIFEVDNKSITHRADLWSHYGMARDISTLLNTKFKEYASPNPLLIRRGNKKGEVKINVKVEDFALCPRYMAIGLEGIKIRPSPKWMQDRLSAVGSRPINNIVDVTNYVMLELGQPLHAFDTSRINANEKANKSECNIIVRRAKKDEVIKTLDGMKRKLEQDMLLITNKSGPVAIAGVMGGANSEINQQTSSIIIEAANFNFNSVRQTAQKLGLRTESSMRFDKGLDPNLAELGLSRAVELIEKICPGAKVVSNLADEKKYKLKQSPIMLDLNWLNERIGQKFEPKQVRRILEKLGFVIKEREEKFSVTVPTWRAVRDVSIAEDLVEEVARIHGYNNIKPVMPRIDMAAPLANAERQLERKIKNILSVGARLTEVYNYSFLGEQQLLKLKMDPALAIKLANPLSQDLAMLRPSLVPLLLENIKTNQAKENFISIYEIGSIFLNSPGEINKDNKGQETLPFQEKHLAMVLAGSETGDLFRRLKGIIAYLLTSLDLEVIFEKTKIFPAWAQNSATAGIFANLIKSGSAGPNSDREFNGTSIKIGCVAKLDKNITRSWGIKQSAVIAEINFRKLFELASARPVKQFEEPPKYPEVLRDLAFVVNEKILYNNIRKQIINFSNLIKQVELFDVYQGGRLGQGKKNLAFHIIYQADKTLTSQEIDEIQEKLIKHLADKLGAKVRDF